MTYELSPNIGIKSVDVPIEYAQCLRNISNYVLEIVWKLLM